jgi:hypothetical protein
MTTPRKKSKGKIEELERIPTKKLLRSIRLDMQKQLEELGFDGPQAAIDEEPKQSKKGA